MSPEDALSNSNTSHYGAQEGAYLRYGTLVGQ